MGEKHKYLVKVRNLYHLWTDEYYLVESSIKDLEEEDFHECVMGDSFAEIEVERDFKDVQETEITQLEHLKENERLDLEKELATSLSNERCYAEFDDSCTIDEGE